MPSPEKITLKRIASSDSFDPSELTSPTSVTNSSFGYSTNSDEPNEANDTDLKKSLSQFLSPQEETEKTQEQINDEESLRLFKKQSNQEHLSNAEIELLQIKQRKMLFPTLKPLSLEIRQSILDNGIQNGKQLSQAELVNIEFKKRLVLIKVGIHWGNTQQVALAFNLDRNDQTEALRERLLRATIDYYSSQSSTEIQLTKAMLKPILFDILGHYKSVSATQLSNTHMPFKPLPCLPEIALLVCDEATTRVINPVFASLQTLYSVPILTTIKAIKSIFNTIELQLIKLYLNFVDSTSCETSELRLFADTCLEKLKTTDTSNLILPKEQQEMIETSFKELYSNLYEIFKSYSLLIPSQPSSVPIFFKRVSHAAVQDAPTYPLYQEL